MVFLPINLAQFAVRCALPPRRSESPVCATDNKPSCVLHLLGWFIGSRGFSSLERRPEFWVLQCLTLCDPVDYSPPGSSVHGILQARILGWVAISFSISGVGFHFLLQGIFPTGGLNPSLLCLLHWQADSLSLYHLGSPSATVGYHVRSQWREIYLEVEWLCQTQKPPAILKAVFVDEL